LQNKRLKIKSFTLSEMIVVLLITIIVVGLAFSILRLVQKQMGGMQKNYEKGTEVNLLRQALSVDFATYPTIFYTEVTKTLRFENELGYQDYIFEEEWIIRENDTFNLKLKSRSFYLDGIEFKSGQLDAMQLETTKELGSKTIFVHAENAAHEYMQ